MLLISIDSLRADHLGSYGYPRNTSPRIDELAREGVRFEGTMSSTSWTLPSHASLFTGLPNAAHGCNSKRPKLRESAETLAERLRAGGYQTAGFWSGPYLHPVFGLGQGFDEYVKCANFEYYQEHGSSGQGEANQQSHRDVTNPKLTGEVLAWMQRRSESHEERPFFLFVHMWDVHYDFFPPAPFDNLFRGDYSGPMDGTRMRLVPGKALAPADMDQARALYDGEIAWTDMHVGKILDELEARGWKDDTLVILTADHGEEFWERGDFGHRKTLFEESIGIPLVMRLPLALRTPPSATDLRSGAVVSALTSIVDIAPTVLEIAGLDFKPEGDWLAGVSLLPLLEAAQPVGDRLAFSELERPKSGASRVVVRVGPWKLLFEPEADLLLGLWNLQSDPGELNNRMLEEQGRVPEIRVQGRLAYDRLRALARRDPLRGASDAELDALPDDVAGALEDLGYIGHEEGEGE